MKKFEQIIKFGIVGVLAFLIDAGLLYALVRFLYWNAVPASIVSFTVSLIFNYLASMKYVFVHRDDMARWMEVVIFVVSSVIGLLINAFIIWIGTAVIISPSMQQTDPLWYQVYTMGSKLVATAVVMIWNFVIRKWLLDAPAPGAEINKNSFAYRIGQWSLSHGPQGL